MNSTTIAVDVAKSVFEVAVSEYPGQVGERHRLSRGRFSRFLAEHPPATVVMEACGSAHHWAREAQSRAHRVILVPPHAARPYVLRNKTDRTDAKGLLEAFRNDDLRPVPVKSETQQALAALHRLRSTWVATRTARLNTVRGILREFGVVIPTGRIMWYRTFGPCSKTPTLACPACSAFRSARRFARSVSSRNVSWPSSASWRGPPNRHCSSGGSARFPASAS